MRKFLDPKMDFIFNKIMEDEALLLDFLHAVLGKAEGELVSVERMNLVTTKEFLENKYAVLDVKVKTGDGRIINIEIQNRDEKNMSKRTLFNWSKMYGEQVIEGENYRKLNKTICINILNFNYLEDENGFHNIYRLLNTQSKNELKDNTMELHFIELPKYDGYKNISDNESLKAWVEFLNRPDNSNYKENPAIKKAVEKLEILSGDKETIELYKLRKEALAEGNRLINTARIEGKAEGLIEEKYRFVQNLLDILDDETIAQKSELSLEEVREIRKTRLKFISPE